MLLCQAYVLLQDLVPEDLLQVRGLVQQLVELSDQVYRMRWEGVSRLLLLLQPLLNPGFRQLKGR